MGAALRAVNELESEGLLRRYAIGGAVAVLFHAEPVLTYDLDLFVLLPEQAGGLVDLGPLYERLGRMGGTPKGETVELCGIPVQFLPAFNRLIEESVREAVETSVEGVPTRVVGYEHLLAIMAQTGRPKDRERAASLISAKPPDELRLHRILKAHGLSERWATWKEPRS